MSNGIGRRGLLQRSTGAVALAMTGGASALDPLPVAQTMEKAAAIHAETQLGMTIVASARDIKLFLGLIQAFKRDGLSPEMLANKNRRLATGQIIQETEFAPESLMPEGWQRNVIRHNREGKLRTGVRLLGAHLATLSKGGLSLDDLRLNPAVITQAFALTEKQHPELARLLPGDLHEWTEDLRTFVEDIQNAFGTPSTADIQMQIDNGITRSKAASEIAWSDFVQQIELRREDSGPTARQEHLRIANTPNDVKAISRKPESSPTLSRHPAYGEAMQAIRNRRAYELRFQRQVTRLEKSAKISEWEATLLKRTTHEIGGSPVHPGSQKAWDAYWRARANIAPQQT